MRREFSQGTRAHTCHKDQCSQRVNIKPRKYEGFRQPHAMRIPLNVPINRSESKRAIAKVYQTPNVQKVLAASSFCRLDWLVRILTVKSTTLCRHVHA